uniref:SH3 domain-containing protein n=1 Tax=Echeneis naucrates TaxID=173247 RepID=A0A665WJV6_ECHNA
KAVKDFSGPDCRFLSFKKSETIYVYYKLAGRSADLWAGSVGSNFGYFPKDLLAVNHLYTDKELEIPAEETDFVCFDNGFDKFDNYDIDLLLGSSAEENDSDNKGMSDQIQAAADTEKEPTTSADVTDSKTKTEHEENSENPSKVPEDQSDSIPDLEVATEPPPRNIVESDTEATSDFSETAEEIEQKNTTGSVEIVLPERNETKDEFASGNEPISISEEVQIPLLKTTFGNTFDAVTTDEEITKNVTPNEEEETKDVEILSENDNNVKEETPLLTFSEEAVNPPASDSLEPQEVPLAIHDDKPQAAEEKNMWASIGDAVFSVVTGGEKTPEVVSSEEDEDEEETQAAAVFEDEVKDAEPLKTQSPEEPEDIENVQELDPISSAVPIDNKETISDFEVDESDGEVIQPEQVPNQASKPVDNAPPSHHQTVGSTIPVHLVPQEDTQDENASISTTNQTMDHKEEDREELSNDSEDNVDIQDRSVAMDHKEDMDALIEENKTTTDQESIIFETEEYQDLSTEETQSRHFDVQVDENTVDHSLPGHIHDHLNNDFENISQPDVSVDQPEILEGVHKEESEDEEGEEPEGEIAEEREELLEDENALSSSQIDKPDLDKTSLESGPPLSASTPEPEYSDSVMRLTLLRDHFTEEKIEQLQRLLGLKNLYRLEAMFFDLDLELHATRLSHVGTTQDIENTLESILEASENTILDEIEKMLDSRTPKHNYNPTADTSSLDEETEILDDFQELAFSLRQKYSTASDSTPLATEEPTEHPADSVPQSEDEDNLTVTDDVPAVTVEEQIILDELPPADVSMQKDGGHFNKNKDNQPGFSASDKMQKVPQATLENPLDMGLGVELQHVSESLSPPDFPRFHRAIFLPSSFIPKPIPKHGGWPFQVISLLPEEWKPGETLYGCPWEAVLITAFVGVVSFTLFFWRTVLSVSIVILFLCFKSMHEQKYYLCPPPIILCLISCFLTQTTVLLDEAKIREDARNVQHKCVEKEYSALKEENKTLKATIKGWEDKHKELNDQIKTYQKSQKELEDSVVLKDHNVEVLSELLADLDACDLQKGDAFLYCTDKKTVVKNRIKQMMDVSRVQTTLTVVEEERDRFMTKLLNEEKSRKALEEQHQELDHVENQFKILQQKNEIMVEMYQQKENALQQRLTKEELERRSKENLLSEVGGKAVEAEEQVKVLRQRINEMEEQMKKTEEVYKEQVNARNAERALNQEKLESSKLRDSYGPSPVSGGAPSPPLMIEGPRRPPSAPVGRRIDQYGESLWIPLPSLIFTTVGHHPSATTSSPFNLCLSFLTLFLSALSLFTFSFPQVFLFQPF